MLKKSLIFLINFAITSSSFADEASVELMKGQVAPFSGVLLSLKKADFVYKELRTKELTEELNKSLSHSLEVTQKNYNIEMDKTNTLSKRNNELAQQLQSSQQTSDWEKAFYVGVGIAVMVLGTYVIKATR